jgi:hypothetical protein
VTDKIRIDMRVNKSKFVQRKLFNGKLLPQRWPAPDGKRPKVKESIGVSPSHEKDR